MNITPGDHNCEAIIEDMSVGYPYVCYVKAIAASMEECTYLKYYQRSERGLLIFNEQLDDV